MNKKLTILQSGIFIAIFALAFGGLITWVQLKQMMVSTNNEAVQNEQFLQEGDGNVDIYLQYTDVTDMVYTVDVLAKSTVNKQLLGGDFMYKYKTSDLEFVDIAAGPNLTISPDKASILAKPATIPEYLYVNFSVLAENMNQSIAVVNNNIPAKLATLKFKRLTNTQTVIEAVSPNNTVALTDSGNNQIAMAGDLTLPAYAPASCGTLTTQTTCNNRIDCLWDVNTCVPITNINGASTCREQGGQPIKFASLATLTPNLCAGVFNIEVLDLNSYYCQCPAGRCWDGSGCSAVVNKCEQNGYCEAGENSTNCPNDCGATAKAELTVYESSKFYSPQPPKTTDSIYVRFTVKNDGNAVAAASSVKIYVDTNSNPTNATPVVTTLSAPQLAAGGSSQLSYTFAKNYFTAGIHTVSALLDAGNAVSETNEGNNFVKIAEFTVVADPSASCPELATQTICNSRIDCFWDVNTCVPLTNIQGGTTCREQGGEPAKYATRQALAASLCAGSTNIDVVDLAKYSCQCGAGKCWNGTTCETPVSKCEKNGYCEAGETAANCADDCFNSNCNQITSQTECSDKPACNWNTSLTKCFFKGDISGNTPGTPDGKVNNMDLIYMLQHWNQYGISMLHTILKNWYIGA